MRAQARMTDARLYAGDFFAGLSPGVRCSVRLSKKIFPRLRTTGTGFLRMRRKSLKGRERLLFSN